MCACLLAAGAQARALSQGPGQTPAAPADTETARGVGLYKRGDNEAAIKALRAATGKEKSDADAWHYLGLALVKQGKLKDARKAFERAAALRPNHAATLTALAYALLRLGETDGAAVAAEKSVALEPNDTEARYVVGVVRLRNNSNTAALEQAEAALRLNPSFAPALYLKVLALAAMSANAVAAATDETQDVRKVLLDKAGSRVEEAEAALRRFAELEPGHEEIEPLREQLKTLRLYGSSFGATRARPGILSSREVTTKARILKRPEPTYTERARQAGTRGAVLLRMVLAADGTVQHIVAVRRLPDGLTEAAIRAARLIKFIPATKDGQPVSQFVTIQYHFNIY
jgi:TonB family protein